jgi:hypothetical protein
MLKKAESEGLLSFPEPQISKEIYRGSRPLQLAHIPRGWIARTSSSFDGKFSALWRNYQEREHQKNDSFGRSFTFVNASTQDKIAYTKAY